MSGIHLEFDKTGGFEWTCGECAKPHVAAKVEFSDNLQGNFREALVRKMLGGKGAIIYTEKLNMDQEGIRFVAEDGAVLTFNLKFFVAALKQGPQEMALAITKRWLVK